MHTKKGKDRGKVIRLSPELRDQLEQQKGPKRGWDTFLRRTFGLRSRKGLEQPVVEMWVLPKCGLAFNMKSHAKGAAVKESARTGNEIERPVRMREVLL